MLRPPSRLAFTLLEVCLAVMISLLVLSMAVPALSGVFVQRKAEESFAQFDECVAEARSRAVAEGRAYVVLFGEDGAETRPDGEEAGSGDPAATFAVEKGESLTAEFPAAIRPPSASVWTFWPNGVCEPAVIRFSGPDGTWAARYNPLTARAEVEYE